MASSKTFYCPRHKQQELGLHRMQSIRTVLKLGDVCLDFYLNVDRLEKSYTAPRKGYARQNKSDRSILRPGYNSPKPNGFLNCPEVKAL